MSEMRDLQEDREYIKGLLKNELYPRRSQTIAAHYIDRSIAAEKERDELLKRVKELSADLVEWKTEAKRQYMLFNNELDITQKLRDVLEEAGLKDPTRLRFEMDANGNLKRIEETP